MWILKTNYIHHVTHVSLLLIVSFSFSLYIIALGLLTEFYAMPTHTSAYIDICIWGRTCTFFLLTLGYLILYHIKSIHSPTNFLTAFFFMADCYSTLNVYLIFIVHSSVDEHLSWCHFLAAIANSAPINMSRQNFQ